MNVEQKNISIYFTTHKRIRLDDIDLKQTISKRDKKSTETIKLGENVNYTIENFFKYSKEEDYMREIKSELKKLELVNSVSMAKRTTNMGKNGIETYFRKAEPKVNEQVSNGRNVFTLDDIDIDDKVETDFIYHVKEIQPASSKVLGYEDVKITNWVRIQSSPDFRGLNVDLFSNIFKYLSFKDMTKFSMSCKTFKKFYIAILNSYTCFVKIDSAKYEREEFVKMLKKAKNLKHIQKLNEVIEKDFGGRDESFHKRVVVRMRLPSKVEDVEKYKGALFEAFHILPRRNNELDNFISNESVNNICTASKYTMKDLNLRVCSKLTNRIVEAISACTFLEKVELSNNRIIDDVAIERIAQCCSNLKTLNLSGLKNITEKSIVAIGENLRFLEGLDISNCDGIKGDYLISLKNCQGLNILLLKGLKLKDNDLVFTDYLRSLKTLSIASKIVLI
jgi:hypothetical protein